jgi:phosphoribosylglycinamide formyltransferase-1
MVKSKCLKTFKFGRLLKRLFLLLYPLLLTIPIMKNIAIFASGAGSNAQKIMDHFKDHPKVRVSLVISNKATAMVLERAKAAGIPRQVFSKDDFLDQKMVLSLLSEHKIEWIVLAGFLLLIPPYLIQKYPKKIINIHPSLLPRHGGAGMYGMKVHQAVLLNKDSETGITIHYVDEHYDEGEILFQAKCLVSDKETVESIGAKVQLLEHAHLPIVIEALLSV